ncbi:hypothetical protein [Methylocapsa aurea]|uniref:hypothetical protein n=1 Tax=Methylocapsa aurea TaxID=663610 RepID=UPI0005692974|nr:hypothetical protein [Methylocapsa aurea]
MPRPRSLIVSMEITVAGSSHNCRNNDSHRIAKGVKRLTIKSDGDKQHYCLGCAKGFLVKDVERLRAILAEIESGAPPAAA